MGFWSRLFGRETKAVDISEALWAAINNGAGFVTRSAQTVSTTKALETTAFYRGVMVIAEGVAQLPVELYRQSESGSEPATDHPLHEVLLHQPNLLQDSFQFFRTVLMHAAASGNSLSYKVMVNGVLRELIPLRPESVQVELGADYRRKFHITIRIVTGKH